MLELIYRNNQKLNYSQYFENFNLIKLKFNLITALKYFDFF